MSQPLSEPPRTVILLDVDGVLVHPVGYKAALTATVNALTAGPGMPAWGPDEDEIATFEACGITNEWDSTAICVDLLLRASLRQRPDLWRGDLAATFAAIRAAGVRVDRPDFVGVMRQVGEAMTRPSHAAEDKMPSQIYLDLIAEQLEPAERVLVEALLGDVYNLSTLTTRLFQTYILGSACFETTYGEPAPFASDSFLVTRDWSLLSADMRDRLTAWAALPGHGAAIFTARPSLPPVLPGTAGSGSNGKSNGTANGATNGAASSVYSPEAELAAELVGLDGAIPLLAQGRIAWIAERHGRQPSDYVKPSPVHSLAAIGAAASGDVPGSLEAAAVLVEANRLTGPLAALADRITHVVLFEDSITGIRAVQQAAERLRQAGLAVECEIVGVSSHAAKRAALSANADHVVDDVNEGLALIVGR